MKRNIDDIVKNALRDFQGDAPNQGDLWAKIETSLDAKKKKPLIPIFWYPIAAGLLIFGVAMMWLNTDISTTETNLASKNGTGLNIASGNKEGSNILSNDKNLNAISKLGNKSNSERLNIDSRRNRISKNINSNKSISKNSNGNYGTANFYVINKNSAFSNLRRIKNNNPSQEGDNNTPDYASDNLLKSTLMDLVKVNPIAANGDEVSLKAVPNLLKKESVLAENSNKKRKSVDGYSFLTQTGFWDQPGLLGIQNKTTVYSRFNGICGTEFNPKPASRYVFAGEYVFQKTGIAVGLFYSSVLNPFKAINSHSISISKKIEVNSETYFNIGLTGNYIKRHSYLTNNFISTESGLTKGIIFYPDVEKRGLPSFAKGADAGITFVHNGFSVSYSKINLIKPTFDSEDILMRRNMVSSILNSKLNSGGLISVYSDVTWQRSDVRMSAMALFSYKKLTLGSGFKQLNFTESSGMLNGLIKYDFCPSSSLFISASKTVFASNPLYDRKGLEVGFDLKF